MALAQMAMGSDSDDGEPVVVDPYCCSTPPHKTGHHARSPLGVLHALQNVDVTLPHFKPIVVSFGFLPTSLLVSL